MGDETVQSFFLKVCLYLCACLCVHGHQNRVSDPLELDFQEVMNLLAWVLGTETQFSGRAVCACNCCAVSPARYCCVLIVVDM